MSQPQLNRTIGLLDATMFVSGSMIGSGIFLLTADMARDVGSSGWLLLAWLVSGIITLMAALSYGELAGMMPNAGGQYVYIRRAFGKLPAFLYGWTVFTVIQTGVIAAVAVAFAKFTAVFFPALADVMISFNPFGEDKPREITYGQIVAVISIIITTVINSSGVKTGTLVQRIFTSAKLVALFFLIIAGIIIGLKSGYFGENFTDSFKASQWVKGDDGTFTLKSLSGIGLLLAFGGTMINSLFAADAWNNVTFIAGEIKDPKRNIPRSLVLGTLIVTVLYCLANVAYLGLLPLHGSPLAEKGDVLGQGIQFAASGRVGTAAATMIFGAAAVSIMAVLIMISTFGCNNGLILAGARLYYAMGNDGLFFKNAGRLNKNGVPAWALWIQCIWACLLCFSGTYSDLIKYATFSSLIFYIVTIAGIFVLRRKEPNAERPYKAFGYPFVPALYIIIALAICVDLMYVETTNSGVSLIVVALGLPIYFLTKAGKRSSAS